MVFSYIFSRVFTAGADFLEKKLDQLDEMAIKAIAPFLAQEEDEHPEDVSSNAFTPMLAAGHH
jgi:hypothetical protein